MLLVDEVLELEPGVRAVGLRRVTEADCEGHFPGHPVLPGVHVTEALAQVAALVFLAEAPDAQGQPLYLVGIDGFRFRRPVRPGEALRLEARVDQARRGFYRFAVEATVDGERAAEGVLLATVGR